ncbi:DUF6585 family protein [Dactylosporangium sp. NPDC049140]|uniref:DUF6585 family protein n=1 Tax=Dactylosporangium sp. NPDC049140 TaxID=3155647 RepID=UPI0033F19CAF
MIPHYRGAVIGAVVGVAGLALAAFLATSSSVSCDGHDMSPGDQCVHISDSGTRTVNSFDDELSSQRTTGALSGGGIAVLFLGLAGAQLAGGRRRERESAAAGQATRELLSIPLPPDPAAPANPPPPTIPADAVQAAWQAQLGGYVTSLQPGKRSAALVYVGLLAAVGILMFALAAGRGGTQAVVFGLIALVPVAAWVAVLVRSPLVSKKARQLGFHLFAHGFVRATAAGVQAYRWDQIVTIYQSIIRQQVYGATTNTNYIYALQFADGRALTLNNFSADMRVLGPILQEQVARVQVPRALQYLHAGRPIPFGAYTLTNAGVTNGGKSAPWSEIGGLKVANGALRLSRRDGKAILGGRKVSTIPNFLTFATLVERMAGQPASNVPL